MKPSLLALEQRIQICSCHNFRPGPTVIPAKITTRDTEGPAVEERSHDYRKQPFAARTRREDRGHACGGGAMSITLITTPTARPPARRRHRHRRRRPLTIRSLDPPPPTLLRG